MNKPSPHKQTLEKIQSTKAFDHLEPFKNSDLWSTIPADELELLAELFVLQGEMHLKNKDSKAFESFELASKAAPKSVKILFKQASICIAHQEDANCLKFTCKVLEAACSLDPQFFDAWYTWANALVELGVFHNDACYFQEADEKFQRAHQLIISDESVAYPQEFFWHWGLCWYVQGKYSGEAMDLSSAISKFRQADRAGFENISFWNDYGNALFELGLLISNMELLFEAIEWHHRSIKAEPKQFDGWYYLGCSYYQLYDIKKHDEYFKAAEECFKQALIYKEDDFTLWLMWGRLLLKSGKSKRNPELLQESLEKFAKADSIEHDNCSVLIRWGEAQMLNGSFTENLEQLHSAQQKILRALKIEPANYEIWYIHGCSFVELGRYFNEERYYKQAIEKFQQALSLNRKAPLPWYGLALTHFAIAERTESLSTMEKAARYCARVIEFSGGEVPHFWNDWGITLMKLAEMTFESQQVKEAIDKFEHALHLSKEQEGEESNLYIECLYNYGCAWDFLGDLSDDAEYHEHAVQILKQVLTLDPENSHARYNLALAYSHLGETTSDLECFQRANDLFQAMISEDPEDEIVWNDWATTVIHLAGLMSEPAHPEQAQNFYKDAETKLVRALSLGNKQAIYNLACLHSLNDNLEVAMLFLAKADAAKALPDIDDMLHDDWLENLRATTQFHDFLQNKQK